MTSPFPINADVTLAAGAEAWLSDHRQFIKPNTLKGYKNSVRLLCGFVGELPLRSIGIGQIRAYQAMRSKFAGPYLINMETSVLQMILKQAGEWPRLREFFKPLKVPKRRGGHTLTDEEEKILRDVAFSKPKWRVAAHAMTIMLSTTMGFGELRFLRRRDVDMNKRLVIVRDGAKNIHRDRTIPLNADAHASMAWFLERWAKLGGSVDSEYILPHRPRSPHGPWIFTEPMHSIATAFSGIQKASGFTHFRIYDCRVQAVTKLLGNPNVSIQVCREIAGHVSQAMTDRYSIQRFATKMAAVEVLESCPPAEATNTVAPTTPSPDLMQPAIQAEIARQVAAALQLMFNGGAR